MPGNDRAQTATAFSRFQQLNLTPSKLRRADFDLTNDTASERTEIAAFQAPYPLALRESNMRLAFTYHEGFTTNGTGSQTISLANDIIDTPNTNPFVVYTDQGSGTWTRTTATSIDYANDSFDYDDGGSAEELEVFYVVSNPVRIEIWKEKPGSTGNVGEMVYDDYTGDLHARDQNEMAPRMSFNKSQLQPVVPRDWYVRVYADGSTAFSWNDGQGNDAINALLQVPVMQAPRDVSGLSRAVTQDIGARQ